LDSRRVDPGFGAQGAEGDLKPQMLNRDLGAQSVPSIPRNRFFDFSLILVVKTLACALALALGFRAVSDDDFARITIAQTFAHQPVLDPSGTSWLPFPFWITGSAMLLAGRSLLTARIVAFVLGLFSAVIVTAAAFRLTNHRRGAMLGATLAAIFPWSVRLGIATVPELLTAALGVFALASLADPSPRLRALAGLGLVCATLSRYDVWPLAAAFAAYTLYDFVRLDKSVGKQKILFGAAIILSVAGPALWIAWNHISRGNAFDSLDRVAAYRRALGTTDDGAFMRLFAYPLAMIRHEPELFGALGILLAISRTSSLRPLAHEAWHKYKRPLIVALLQLAFLSFAMIKDGAPTHHPERALLVHLLLCALLVGNLAVVLLPQTKRTIRFIAAGAAAAVLILSLVIVRRWFRGEDFTVRQDEVAAGLFVRQTLPEDEKILVDVVDYGYFAFVAALGRPEDAVLDRNLDPRLSKQGSSFEDMANLQRKVEQTKARWIFVSLASPVVKNLGPPEFVHGKFGVWNERAWR
jgi:Dolichyl-phosphate-mannose-protein mannosyltransferase